VLSKNILATKYFCTPGSEIKGHFGDFYTNIRKAQLGWHIRFLDLIFCIGPVQ